MRAILRLLRARHATKELNYANLSSFSFIKSLRRVLVKF
jgi:hypothetical protein